MGYVFGIVHKVLYDFNWVIWAYVALMLLVMVDLALYWRNWRRERQPRFLRSQQVLPEGD